MISDEDFIFLEDVARYDGTELGEYIHAILEVYNEVSESCAISDVFKKALYTEVKRLVDDSKEFFEIEEYTETITKTITGKRLKDKE